MPRDNFRILILVTFYLFTCSHLFGTTSVDSLKMHLDQKQGEEKLKILDQLSDYYINTNLDSSYYFLTQLKELATANKNIRFEAIACSSMGLNHFYQGKYFEAEDCVKNAIGLQLQIGDTADLADSYNILAGIYGESGQYAKSTNVLFEAIAIYEAQNDLSGVVKAYNNLGYLFMKLENYEKAKEYYQKALSIIDKNNIDYNKGFLYSNLGICYKEFGNNNAALTNYHLALNQYKAHATLNAIPMLYQSFGNLFAFRLNNPDSAFYYLNEGIRLSEKYDPNTLVELYSSLGQLYQKQKQYNKSSEALIKSLQAAENSEDINGKMSAHFQLSEINKELKNYAVALNHFEKYSALKDSMDAKATKTAIARLNEKYENDKNKILIQQLNEKQKADERLMAAMIAGIAFLTILLMFIVYALFQRRKRNKLEKELLNAEKQKVKEELQFKNKQMASQALMMMQKNKILQGLHESIQDAKKEAPENLPGFLNTLKNQINHNLQSEKDWELFKLYFEQVNKTFFKKLKTINPGLTQNDLRLAALIKLRFNIKEAASVLNLAPNSIKGARSRLRSKLHLENSEDLALFIEGID